MSSVNKVILVGNVGKDPEIRTMQNGSRFTNFTLATSEKWKDKATGEYKENTQWHKVAVWNDALISVVERFVKKGSKLFVEGMLETRKWTDSDGKDNYSTEVVLRAFNGAITLLDSRKDNEPNHQASVAAQSPNYAADLDDEIPGF